MNSILKLGLNLFVICAVSAGLLAGTNEITSPLIAKRSEQASNEARQAVLSDAKEFKLLDSSKYKATSDVEVVEVYEGLKWIRCGWIYYKSSSKRIRWRNRTYGRYKKRWRQCSYFWS